MSYLKTISATANALMAWFGADTPRTPLCDVLRSRGAIILCDQNVPGAFNAVAMYGSTVAGVLDLRGRSARAGELFQQKMKHMAQSMGFTSLMVVHDSCVPNIPEALYFDLNPSSLGRVQVSASVSECTA